MTSPFAKPEKGTETVAKPQPTDAPAQITDPRKRKPKGVEVLSTTAKLGKPRGVVTHSRVDHEAANAK